MLLRIGDGGRAPAVRKHRVRYDELAHGVRFNPKPEAPGLSVAHKYQRLCGAGSRRISSDSSGGRMRRNALVRICLPSVAFVPALEKFSSRRPAQLQMRTKRRKRLAKLAKRHSCGDAGPQWCPSTLVDELCPINWRHEVDSVFSTCRVHARMRLSDCGFLHLWRTRGAGLEQSKEGGVACRPS